MSDTSIAAITIAEMNGRMIIPVAQRISRAMRAKKMMPARRHSRAGFGSSITVMRRERTKTRYHPRALKVIETGLPGVLLIEPKVFADERGFFLETFNATRFLEAGIPAEFVQDNHSRSARGVLRGLHYQLPNAQGKLVRCSRGAIFDVAVDIREGSPAFGRWYAVELSEENKRMLWVPPDFAHGFCALTDDCDVIYKVTRLYDPANDHGIIWNDPELGIRWPVAQPRLSPKDAAAPRLKDAKVLPRYQSS